MTKVKQLKKENSNKNSLLISPAQLVNEYIPALQVLLKTPVSWTEKIKISEVISYHKTLSETYVEQTNAIREECVEKLEGTRNYKYDTVKNTFIFKSEELREKYYNFIEEVDNTKIPFNYKISKAEFSKITNIANEKDVMLLPTILKLIL